MSGRRRQDGGTPRARESRQATAQTPQRKTRTPGATAESDRGEARRAAAVGAEAARVDLCVLLVEDDDSDAALITEILGRMAAVDRVVRAVDGCEALDLVAASSLRPDVILLDLNMPRMSGFEFLKAARDLPELRATPVVVLTTSARYADVRAALGGTASSYIVKPESVAELVDKIGTALGGLARGDYLERRL